MRGWVLVLVLVPVLVIVCGACEVGAPSRYGGRADSGRTAWVSVDGAAIKDGAPIEDGSPLKDGAVIQDAASIEAAATTLPAGCGGTVEVSGLINDPGDPFTAGYVYAYDILGCGAIGLTIADRQTRPTTTLT